MRAGSLAVAANLAWLALLLSGASCSDRSVSPTIDWPEPSEITSQLGYHCVIIDGGLKCWAERPDASNPTWYELLQLQRDELDPEPPLPDIDFGPGAVVLDARSMRYGGCVALRGQGVKCWGQNDGFGFGVPDQELIIGDEPDERGAGMPLVDLGSDPNVVDITEDAQPCARFADGRVKCWGWGSASLGLGDTQPRGDDVGEMGDALPYVDLGTDVRAAGLTADSGHVCIWSAEGRVKCWGDNARGELGIDSDDDPVGDEPGEMGDALPFVDLGQDVRVVQVSIGEEHTCALTDDGRVKCWGANSTVFPPNPPYPDKDPNPDGRLGLGDTLDRRAPLGDALPYVDLGTDVRAVAIATCHKRSCAVLHDGRLKCWGSGSESIGDEPGEMGDALPYVDLGTDRTVQALGCNCALLDDDSIKCWNGLGYDPEEPMGDALEPVLTREDLYGPA